MPRKKSHSKQTELNFVKRNNYSTDTEYNIACKIQQRRLQILVHSYIYYQLDDNIIDDNTWSKWSKELVILQQTYPQIAKTVVYDEAFSDFDASTGYNLPHDKWIEHKAESLLEYNRG